MASIRDSYQVQFSKEIGRGATGRVFTGTRKADSKQAAVKMVAKSALSKELLRSISCEIQSLRELNHPHIVKLYDMFEDPNNFYICMELIHGGELFDRITKKTYYSENDAKELCRIILSAIKHCHDKQIVHRDLKPENLLMAKENDDADVKLVDFGFAEHCTDGRSLSGQMGTPMYMAPEIWSDQKYGKPVDLWAFGVITYILLAGYPPFSDDNRARLVAKITKAQFAFHEQYWGEVSAEAKDFITKLLVVDPNARMNVDQALAHRWVCVHSDNNTIFLSFYLLLSISMYII